jgi:diguanylate cyclase (GGDEF)-like protein/PAS domain S-box-containing protein
VNSSGPGRGGRTNSSPASIHRAEHAGAASYPNDGWLRTVLENTSDVICVLAADGTFRYISPAVEWVLGYLPEDLVGTVAFDYVHPEDAASVAEAFAQIVKTPGVLTPVEFRVRTANGSLRHVQAVPNNQLDNSVLRGVVVTFRDLTDQVRADEKVRFQARLLDAVGQSVIATDRQGKIVYWNRAAEELHGWSAEEATGRSVLDVVLPEQTPDQRQEIMLGLGEGRSWSGEFELRRRDGTLFPAMITTSPTLDDRGDLVGIIGVSTDITERVRAETRLREAEERYRTLVERIPAIVYVDEAGEPSRTTYVSPQNETMLGYAPEEYLKDPDFWIEIMHPEDRESVLAENKRTDRTGEPFRVEYRQFTRSGRVVWIRDEAHLVRDEKGEPLYWLGVQTDVTERRALEGELRRRASHDLLTGLPNRQVFMDRLSQVLEHTRRRRGRKVAVLFMDLDKFKVINDSLGHEVGDRLLVVVAQRLRRCLRPEDTLARFGGDEFVVLLEEVESPDEAARVAERIIRELGRPFVLDGRELFASPSIGIALGDARQTAPDALLRDADTAMYRVKEKGSGYRMFDPAMYEQAVRRLDLENDLRRAIEARELVLHYQPMTSLRTGGIVGVEALARWNHPKQGLLTASEFISISEETGMIVPLGRWVLNEACRQVKEWQRRYPKDPPLSVSVNLSARQLHDPGIVAEVADALEGVGLDPRSLILEITESGLVEDRADTGDRLRQLKALGVGLTIDDFGTGYSSLSYLKHLTIDRLKLDRTFVGGLDTDHVGYSIVMATVTLGHAIGIEVVAEGVETTEEFDTVRTLNCDVGQGYYWWGPRPTEEVAVLLAPNSPPEPDRGH